MQNKVRWPNPGEVTFLKKRGDPVANCTLAPTPALHSYHRQVGYANLPGVGRKMTKKMAQWRRVERRGRF